MSEVENKHHIFFKKDRVRLPRNFDLEDPSNKVKLPVSTHIELHTIVDRNPYLRNNLETRVYMANMAYNEELDLVPREIYFKMPKVRK